MVKMAMEQLGKVMLLELCTLFQNFPKYQHVTIILLSTSTHTSVLNVKQSEFFLEYLLMNGYLLLV